MHGVRSACGVGKRGAERMLVSVKPCASLDPSSEISVLCRDLGAFFFLLVG